MENKDWLDLCWKYFDRHADQRISYFNFFVVFSTILTSAAITVLAESVDLGYAAIPIGIIQIFVAYIFLKIEERNRFLTKHAENAIKHFERRIGHRNNQFKFLFNLEEEQTIHQRKLDRARFFPFRLISHGRAYKIIYISFMFWGCLEVCAASIMPRQQMNTLEAPLNLKKDSVDSNKHDRLTTDTVVRRLMKDVDILKLRLDKMEILYKGYQLRRDTTNVLK
jgi:hypothetical protein